MLKHLYVKNFILIDEADLDFDAGFSVFTGETGAGKSILIDAISLLCGQRAQAGFVTKGENKALIEGVFDFSANPRCWRYCRKPALMGMRTWSSAGRLARKAKARCG